MCRVIQKLGNKTWKFYISCFRVLRLIKIDIYSWNNVKIYYEIISLRFRRSTPPDCPISHIFSLLYLRKNEVEERPHSHISSYNSPKTTRYITLSHYMYNILGEKWGCRYHSNQSKERLSSWLSPNFAK